MDLSIVILSYNTHVLLNDCLRSVMLDAQNLAAEIFIVDSGSTDGSIELVRESFPAVKLIITEGFGGFAYANNLALHQASGRYQLLLNSDTVLPRGALRQCVAFMDAHSDAGVMGVKLVKGDGTLDLACRRSFPTPGVAFAHFSGLSKLFPRSPLFARYNLTFLDPDETYEVDSVCGAFMLTRQAALNEVGLLDEQFFFYGEDLDWAYRFKQAGWKVYYYADVKVVHYKGQTSRQQSDRMITEFYNAMRLFYRKHYAARGARLERGFILAGISLGECLAKFRNRLRPADAKRVTP